MPFYGEKAVKMLIANTPWNQRLFARTADGDAARAFSMRLSSRCKSASSAS